MGEKVGFVGVTGHPGDSFGHVGPKERMEDGGWRMEDGGWRMEDGGGRREDGGGRREDGGGRSAKPQAGKEKMPTSSGASAVFISFYMLVWMGILRQGGAKREVAPFP
jgi:hypothetical protein